MSITRSKSAPFPISSLQKSSSGQAPRSAHYIPRSKSLLSTSPPGTIYSRTEQRDPFCLSSFYSAAILEGVSKSEDEWDWVPQAGDEEHTISEKEISRRSDGMFSASNDELMRETIKAEDKLGVLSLSRCLLGSTIKQFYKDDMHDR